MFDLKKITQPLMRKASMAALQVKKVSPEICLIGGMAAGVATVIFACRATLKADEVLDKLAEEKEMIKEAEKEAEKKGEEYNAGKDMTGAYARAAVGFAKLYAPSAALGALSCGLILCSYGTLKKRNLGLIAAYTTLDEGFKKYRKRVVDKFGEEADREFSTGVTKKKVLVKEEDPETGEIKEEEREVETMDNVEMDDFTNYDRVFSEETSSAFAKNKKSRLYTDAFLTEKLAFFNYLLDTRGYVYLSEVYEGLGFYHYDAKARLVGWILDPANPKKHEPIKFANTPDGMPIPSIYRPVGDHVSKSGRIQKQYEARDYYLTFNIDGMIWNLTQYWMDKGYVA